MISTQFKMAFQTEVNSLRAMNDSTYEVASCKLLIENKPYRILKLEKSKSSFTDGKKYFIATLELENVYNELRVFLPPRFDANKFTDTFINYYNNVAPISDKMFLIFKGMKGKYIDVDFYDSITSTNVTF